MKYEYKVVSIPISKSAAERQVSLNIQGTNGWELINTVLEGTTVYVYLKRLVSS